ncbi:MAG: HAMP domain-containing protein [Candidatus Aminicenantes bacterium]|nr:HAMP domain-containing protein [Candidatus Aminicenantes bacterium]
MTSFKKPGTWTSFHFFLAIGSILSLLFLILSIVLPVITSSNYYERSLKQLRNKAESIKREFGDVIADMNEKIDILTRSPLPEEKDKVFFLFKNLRMKPESEGVAYYESPGNLVLWLGQVIDLHAASEINGTTIAYRDRKSAFLIRHKASAFLVSVREIDGSRYIVLYKLLAFLPEFKTPYLREYHFLKEGYLENCSIAYWDSREDLSGFEKLFSRYNDEFIGEPQLQREIQTIFFPLRNEKKEIVATVTLSSPSLSSKISSQKEVVLLIFFIMFGTTLTLLLIEIVKSPGFHREKKAHHIFLAIIILGVLRSLFFPLSTLEKLKSSTLFSPSIASFISLGNLTGSPADIFLTSLFLFLITCCFAFYISKRLKKPFRKFSFPLMLALNVISASAVIGLIFIFQEILFRLVFHSNLNLTRFSFNGPLILLHISIVLLFLVIILIAFAGLRWTLLHSPKASYLLLTLFIGFLLFSFVLSKPPWILLFILQAVILFFVFILAHLPYMLRKKRVWLTTIFLATLFIYSSFHNASSIREQTLLQDSLRNIIQSQETWGVFMIRQSLPEIDKRQGSVLTVLKNLDSSDLAHSLWEKTLIAKFNWYSSFEILDAEGEVRSRFSLNVPEVFRLNEPPPSSRDWSIMKERIHFMGITKDFLVSYKDFYEEGALQGRIIIYLSIDYDMLPFLYSANPYFELLRVTSIPSLNQLKLGFAVFDLEGKLLFNPNKISTGIPAGLLARINTPDTHIWSEFSDNAKTFQSLYFKQDDRIYALFLPKKNFLKYSVEFLRLFLVYFATVILCLFLTRILIGAKKFKNPLWSFSNRVYITFVAVSLLPLLFFTYSTRYYFSRIFTQRITEEAEVRADFARRVMQDFVAIQQEEQVSLTIPADDVVFWVGSTISNDVNLYQDGRLISSSRREFIDYGLLPEVIDGEIYYKIQFENNPFYTQMQRIGDYSFHTLTIPYPFQDSLVLISLPFPLEQQEISDATVDLIEFLLFASVFLIIVVLILARGIGGMIVTPIQKLLKGTREVSLGNLETHISHKGHDEMKNLINGFNAMVTNLKTHQQELADMSKKVAAAEMARKVAHEIKNPLTPIQLSAEHLLKVYGESKEDFDKVLRESTSYIISEVENLRKIAHEFLETSKETSLQKERLDLREIIRQTLDPYAKLLSERIEFKESYNGEEFHFMGDRAQMKIVLRNILNNALESIKDKGRVYINLASDNKMLYLEIADSGVGIEREMLDRIFEPYFSTKDAGTGLGLPIAKKIIEDHGGKVHAVSRKEGGIKITINLPKNQDQSEPPVS